MTGADFSAEARPTPSSSDTAKSIVPTQAPHTDQPTPSTSQASSPAKRPFDLPLPMPSRRAYNDTSMRATPSASSSKVYTLSLKQMSPFRLHLFVHVLFRPFPSLPIGPPIGPPATEKDVS
ncbi:hypothetical protein CVT26_005328 [Gymnopilus dilepis]|uniref:Uncharacterized protein n=1 Tax=Gymnopilus dilepis TaxID=231916 RepID=A0A409WJE2_9AGAR|nr:hypothetical protein CVT26_005328 [Gymnopilus dilepis]